MNSSLVANPPFNISWEYPLMVDMDERFQLGVPPKGNANYAFILDGLSKSDRCVFIFDMGTLFKSDKKIADIRKKLVQKNWLEAVIECPEKMFYHTSIPVIVLIFNKKKEHNTVQFIKIGKEKCCKEERKQRGQFGGLAHTNRVYTKSFNAFSDEFIQEIVENVKERKTVERFSKPVTLEEIEKNDFNLNVSRYIDTSIPEEPIDFKSLYNEVRQLDVEIEQVTSDLRRMMNDLVCVGDSAIEEMMKDLI